MANDVPLTAEWQDDVLGAIIRLDDRDDVGKVDDSEVW